MAEEGRRGGDHRGVRLRHGRGDHAGRQGEARRRRVHHRRRWTRRDHDGPARYVDRHSARDVRRHARLDGPAQLIARPTAVTVVVTSIAAPSTSPVIPPNRRTQCATSTAPHAVPTMTTTGPCHGRASASTASPATATAHASTIAAGWVPAASAPSELPAAAGTDRWHAATAATRPAITATITATALNCANASDCSNIATTTAATPNGP